MRHVRGSNVLARRIASGVLGLLLVGGSIVPAEEPKQGGQGALKLSFGLPTKRPILCTRKLKVNATLGAAGSPGVDMVVDDELRFIDEHENVDVKTEKGSRKFVLCSTVINGEINDSCLTGVELEYSRDKAGDHLRIVGSRTLPQRILDDCMRAFVTLGIWLDLPKRASVGEQFKMDLSDLAPVLVSGELPIKSAQAEMTLASFDAETGLARMSGQATIHEQGQRDGRDMEGIYTGECVLQTRPAEKRVLSVTFSGKFKMEMQEGPVQVTGGGDFTIELVTELGEAVEKARKQKARHRQRVFVAPLPRLTLELPSYYGEMTLDEGVRPYVRTLDSADGNAVIRIDVAKGDTRDPKAYLALVEAELKKAGAVKSQEVTSPLGKGRAFLLEEEGEKGEKMLIRSEFYPHGRNQYAIYKLVGNPRAFAAALEEFNKARKTLKKANR